MKKLFVLILAISFLFMTASEVYGAGNSQITKQPETATTSENGTVSFEIGVRGTASAYSWFFVNPETGQKGRGKSI